MFKVITVFGPICSGKTTYMNRFPGNFRKVDVGDIVRSITGTQVRTHKKDLDALIIEELRREIHYAASERMSGIVIIGIRQLTILQAIQNDCFDLQFEIQRIFLYVPAKILRTRYGKRAAEKDSWMTFEQCVLRDVEIGYLETVEYLTMVGVQVVKNYAKSELLENGVLQ